MSSEKIIEDNIKTKTISESDDYALDEYNMSHHNYITDTLSTVLKKKKRKEKKEKEIKDFELTLHDTFRITRLENLANNEKDLFVPKDINENSLKPYELLIVKSTKTDNEHFNTKNEYEEKVIDDFLDKIDTTTYSPSRENPMQCFLRSTTVKVMNIPTTIDYTIAYDSEIELFTSKDKITQLFRMLLINFVLEKTINFTNDDIHDIKEIDPRSMWLTQETTFYFVNIAKPSSDTIKKSYNSYHKNMFTTMIDSTISSNIFFGHEPEMKTTNSLDTLFPTVSIDKKLENFEISKTILNHPFLFYCVVSNKLQLYKLVISDFSEKKINYKLYQIDSISESSNLVRRPLIISRDITNKFIVKNNDTIIPDNKDNKKFVIDKSKLVFENINLDKIKLVLKKIYNVVSDWALLLNVILYDATKCIKAFISNTKKNKISIEPTVIKRKEIKNLLSENTIEIQGMSSVIENFENTLNALERLVVHIYKISENKLEFDPYAMIKYPESKIMEKFHPLYHLHKLSKSMRILSKKIYDTKYDDFDHDYMSEHIVIISKEKSHKLLTNIEFFECDNHYYQLDNFNKLSYFGITKNQFIIMDCVIESNYDLKLYHRSGNICQILAEGKKIQINIVYENILSLMFIKLKPIETMNGIPYIKLSYTRCAFKLNYNDPINTVLKHGTIIETTFLNESLKKTINKTFFQLDSGFELFKPHFSRIKFFDEIKDKTHLRLLESNENIKSLLV